MPAAIVVMVCYAALMPPYSPFGVGAAQRYVDQHPGICSKETRMISALEPGACEWMSFGQFIGLDGGWVYMGSTCYQLGTKNAGPEGPAFSESILR